MVDANVYMLVIIRWDKWKVRLKFNLIRSIGRNSENERFRVVLRATTNGGRIHGGNRFRSIKTFISFSVRRILLNFRIGCLSP